MAEKNKNLDSQEVEFTEEELTEQRQILSDDIRYM